ncbi:MAG: cation transporter [Selenomonadaceae bacterium]|nr:cation transporter [Selenomonadaceae bacterium]
MKIKNFNSRENYGMFVGLVGIITNLILSAVKLIVGFSTGAISITADALNNFSDAGTSIVMLIGFKMVAIPADEEHPFGHGRAEYLAGFFISVTMIFFGLELFSSSVKKIIEPETLTVDNFTIGILTLTVAAKIFLALFYRYAGRKINSTAIKTAAVDSFTDCIATGAVIVSVIAYQNFSLNIDGIAGAFVSILILIGGWETFKNVFTPLLGEKPTPEFIEDIKKTVSDTPQILGFHDIIIHSYGPKKFFLSMHVEMPCDLKLLDAHEIVDKLERRLQSKFDIFATIHIDPTVTNDEEYNNYLKQSKEILFEIDENLSLHDFRFVPYKAGKKFIFDVTVPENFYMSDREIRRKFQRKLMLIYPTFRAVIHCDHQYC